VFVLTVIFFFSGEKINEIKHPKKTKVRKSTITKTSKDLANEPIIIKQYANPKIIDLAVEYRQFQVLINKILSDLDETVRGKLLNQFESFDTIASDFFTEQNIDLSILDELNSDDVSLIALPDDNIPIQESSLSDIALFFWKCTHYINTLLSEVEMSKQSMYMSKTKWFYKKVDEFIKSEKVDLIIYPENMPYDVGLAITALNTNDFTIEDRLFIDRMIEPVIMKEGKILKRGIVILKKEAT